MTAELRTVDDSLFTADRTALLGSRCTDCSAFTFPRQGGCPRCTGQAMADVPLSRTGTLWTWTWQGFRPKPPYTGTDASFGVGYVELPGQLVVQTRLVASDPEALRIGMPVRFTLVPFRQDPEGPVHTFAYGRSEDA